MTLLFGSTSLTSSVQLDYIPYFSDIVVCSFSSNQNKKNSSGFTRILNQSQTQPIYQKRCIL